MTTEKNSCPVNAPMWWDGGDRAITAREKATIEEHGPSSFSIPLVPAANVDADSVALDIARRFISVDAAGEWSEGQQRAALQVAIAGAINTARTACQPVAQDQTAFQLAGSEPLWCLHVLGMDDVHPAPSKAHAEKAAAWHNEQFKEQAARIGITVEAVVAPWPHSAESHAAGVADFIPEWLIPQWQLDALEANDAPPAQGIDLATVRSALQAAEGLCACCAAIDGYSRNELHAFGLNMRQQFRDALALIEGRDATPGVANG